MGSDEEEPALPECIRMLEGRRMGESAVVNLLFLSDELRDGGSPEYEWGGRAGSEYREEEGGG